jgi:hypothetical protein
MYVCMYVCMYACLYVCMYVFMYVCMYLGMCACMPACMYVCVYVFICLSGYVPGGAELPAGSIEYRPAWSQMISCLSWPQSKLGDYRHIYMADCRWVRRKNDVENGGNIGG